MAASRLQALPVAATLLLLALAAQAFPGPFWQPITHSTQKYSVTIGVSEATKTIEIWTADCNIGNFADSVRLSLP